MTPVEIIEYEDRYHEDFRSMNIEWLDHYNLTEPPDLEVLNDPRKTILEKGGVIYLARYEGQIAGSAALIREHDHYELAKMAVAKSYQKMGISKLLIERCLAKAHELRTHKIVLFSNHQLKAALGLYEKYGFQYIPMKDSPFLTADIKMELILNP
jgi:GNAT superfamily N-acetyltransferase